jgi:hypothetical protein
MYRAHLIMKASRESDPAQAVSSGMQQQQQHSSASILNPSVFACLPTATLALIGDVPGPVPWTLQKELRLMAAATMDQVEAAAMWSRRFKTRGLAAAILAPVTWMAFVAMKHSTPSKSGRM